MEPRRQTRIVRRGLIAASSHPLSSALVERHGQVGAFSLEILSGPPLALVSVAVEDGVVSRVRLNNKGDASVGDIVAEPDKHLRLLVGGDVILCGRTPGSVA